MGRTALREEAYASILDDADAACVYWWFDNDTPVVWQGHWGAVPADATELPDFDALTTDDVARGWQALYRIEKAGKFNCCGSDNAVRTMERALSDGDDCYDYDACVADAVVQLAVFGEVVYG